MTGYLAGRYCVVIGARGIGARLRLGARERAMLQRSFTRTDPGAGPFVAGTRGPVDGARRAA